MKEYKDLCDLKFEIQIRTVLQHAWAELTHDRSYKFSGVLPTDLQRKLNLYAGTLEIVDAAFDEIALSVDVYADKLRNEKGSQLLAEKLNSISISEFIRKLGQETGLAFGKIEIVPSVIEEFERFGLSRIEDLQRVVSEDIIEFYKRTGGPVPPAGFLRTAMFYSNPEKYLRLEPAWKELPKEPFELLAKKYGEQNVMDMLAQYGKEVEPQTAEPQGRA